MELKRLIDQLLHELNDLAESPEANIWNTDTAANELTEYVDNLLRYLSGEEVDDLCENCEGTGVTDCIVSNYGCMTISNPLY